MVAAVAARDATRPRRTLPKWFGGVIGIVGVLVVWQIVGMTFFHTDGSVPPPTRILSQMHQDGWTFYPTQGNKIVHENAQLQQPDGHNIKLLWADFIDAIESRRKGVADIELAHRSSVLPLLAQISVRVGRSLNWDGAAEQFVGDAEANKLLSRPDRVPWVYPVV